MLRSYAAVLRALCLDPDADTHFYRILLKLSLDKAESDWWARLYRELVANGRWVVGGGGAEGCRGQVDGWAFNPEACTCV